MKKIFTMTLALLLFGAFVGASNHVRLAEYKAEPQGKFIPIHDNTLWYLAPATSKDCGNIWMDYCLPIGNGQFGAMTMGGVHQDIVQFNDKTFWTGGSKERGAYQNFGELIIEDAGNNLSDGIFGYVRMLDLDEGVSSVSYTDSKGVSYSCEYLASYPDNCVAIHLTASTSGKLSKKIQLNSMHGAKSFYSANGGTFSGKLQTISYYAGFSVSTQDGRVEKCDDCITVDGATELTIVLTGGTDYSPSTPGYVCGTYDLKSKVSSRLVSTLTKGWNNIYASHVNDYKSLKERMAFCLSGAINDQPTDVLIDSYNSTASDGQKRMLEQLYFHYGRYLLISSSRGVDLPSNLQGIWNDNNNPPWQSDMHANINVQMNYWPAESTNLSELHLPYLNYLYNMALVQSEWREYARVRCGQTVGFANFTENNIFGHCTEWHNDYVEAAAWACHHLWQHYRYTLDIKYLKDTALPVMLSCLDFWMERLTKDPNDGRWVCPNSWSPEHGPDKTITAHAQQIVYNLFDITIKAINELGFEEAGVTKERLADVEDKFAHLDSGIATEKYLGTYGQERNGVRAGDDILREWKYIDYATGNGDEKDHRHLSHIMPLYPFCSLYEGQYGFEAAVNSLLLRGIQSQGWSMGWKMCLWARAKRADMCAKIFPMALQHSPKYVVAAAGGVYYNLLDAHSPFQIDGNFGVCAGMAEMLIQNEGDNIVILPALPDFWDSGSVKGLRAERGFVIDIDWHDGIVRNLSVTSDCGEQCHLSIKSLPANTKLIMQNGTSVKPDADGVLNFATEKGKTYIFKAT